VRQVRVQPRLPARRCRQGQGGAPGAGRAARARARGPRPLRLVRARLRGGGRGPGRPGEHAPLPAVARPRQARPADRERYVITAGNAPAARKVPAAADSPSNGSATQQATLAAKILGTAAAHLAKAAVAEPNPGQWIYYKTVDYSALSGGQPGAASTDDEWITFDGRGSAYYQDGRLLTHTPTATTSGSDVNPWVAWNMTATPKTAYDVLAALPANPQGLLTTIAAKSAGQSATDLGALPVAGGPPTTIAQMLASGHIPANLRAHLATMT
jgi:hypothetical protein